MGSSLAQKRKAHTKRNAAMHSIVRLGRPGRRQNSRRHRYGSTLIRSAAALLALATLAAPASARPFQHYLNGACAGLVCKINFGVVPAGQRLDVKNASCYVRLDRLPGGGDPQVRAMQLLILGRNPATVASAVTMVPALVGKPGIELVFAAEQSLSSFALAQQRFQAYVEISGSKFSQFACHISGDLAKV
jgi:hypothetical protein